MENSHIEWTTHTFNPWHGCAKVSPGCKNCYADAQHNFHYSSLKAQQGTCWGISAPRLAVSADTWKKPLKWNREAQATGTRPRVFCASMADVFEEQSELSRSFAGQTAQVPSGPGKTRTVRFVDIAAERLRLLRLIYDTPHLDWLLLTKRPENIRRAINDTLLAQPQMLDEDGKKYFLWLNGWWTTNPPANVWLGTSVENQEQADARIPHLLAAPAAVRFLSCEPLLGPVELMHQYTEPDKDGCTYEKWRLEELDWVIVGGESGPKARPMHPKWAESLRDQCVGAGVAFHFKQWGEWAADGDHWNFDNEPRTCLVSYNGRSVGQPEGFDMEAARHIGHVGSGPTEQMVHVGKKLAGRLLDGRTWDELPSVALPQ